MSSSPHRPDAPTSDLDDDRLRREAIGWAARLSDREATADDRRSFERWQAQTPAHAHAYRTIARIWNDRQLDDAARHAAKRQPAVTPRVSAGFVWRWARPICAAVACLVAMLWGAQYFDLLTQLQADQHTAVGERRTVRLSDGSMVTLNTESAIAAAFDGTIRTVRLLKGEAFFKVQPDPDRPFIVESGETIAKAVGTEFVVRTQPGADRVTVIEGAVAVSSRRHQPSTEKLTAGHTIEHLGGRLGTVQRIDVSAASAWLQGLLIVDDVPLAHVIEEVQRYYPGAIVLWNREIGERHVTGTYKLDQPSQILYHLTKTLPLRTANLADRIILLF